MHPGGLAAQMSTAYNQLAQSLRENIISGKWPGGHQIETERELCLRYRFSRITVRRAMHILEEENLIVRRQGLGTFVNVRPKRKIPIVRGDFAGSINAHAPGSRRDLLEKKLVPAGDEFSRIFDMPSGELVTLARRLDLIEGRPAALDEVVIPVRYANRLSDEDWRAFDFIERWRRRQGILPDYESQTIEAAPAEGRLARWLKVKRGHPLLVETNLVRLAGGQVVARFVSYYPYEHFQFKSVDRALGVPGRAAGGKMIFSKAGN